MSDSSSKFSVWYQAGQERFLRKWEQERMKGKRFFCIKFALLFALWLTVIICAVDYISGRRDFSAGFVAIVFGVLLLSGYIRGTTSWSRNERRYCALNAEQNDK